MPAFATLMVWVIVLDDASAKNHFATLSCLTQLQIGQSVDDLHPLATAPGTCLSHLEAKLAGQSTRRNGAGSEGVRCLIPTSLG